MTPKTAGTALTPIVTAQTGLTYDLNNLTPTSRRSAHAGLTAPASQMKVGDPLQGESQFSFKIQEKIDVVIPSDWQTPICSVCSGEDRKPCRHIWRVNDYILGVAFDRTHRFRPSSTGSVVAEYESNGDELEDMSYYDVLFVSMTADRVKSIFEGFEEWRRLGSVESNVGNTAAALRTEVDLISRFMRHRRPNQALTEAQLKQIAMILLGILDRVINHDEDYTATAQWTQPDFRHEAPQARNLFVNLIGAPQAEPFFVLNVLREIDDMTDEDDEVLEDPLLEEKMTDLCDRLREHEAPDGYVDALDSLISGDE